MTRVLRLIILTLGQPLRIGTRIRRLIRYTRKFGLVSGLINLYKVLAARGPLLRIRIHQSRTPITLRADTSDIPTFEQVFLWDDYDFHGQLEPKFIIDGGANIGCASVYFTHKYPEARIVAVEPEASNFEMLLRNTSCCPRISPIRAAIWNRSAALEIENADDAKWFFRVRETESKEPALKSITIDEILEEFNAGSIDILKLDIEGAEKEVFSGNLEWLSKVKVLIVELHDQYKPGCTESVYSATSHYDFAEFRQSENVILVRKGNERLLSERRK